MEADRSSGTTIENGPARYQQYMEVPKSTAGPSSTTALTAEWAKRCAQWVQSQGGKPDVDHTDEGSSKDTLSSSNISFEMKSVQSSKTEDSIVSPMSSFSDEDPDSLPDTEPIS